MAQSSLKKARASYSASSPPVDVEGAETSNASGARVWTITLFTIIACLGSMSNGFVLGYSSATIAELNNTETGEHGLSSDSESSSWFAVSISPRSSFTSAMSMYLFELGLRSNWSVAGRPSCRLGVRPFWSQDWNDAWRGPV